MPETEIKDGGGITKTLATRVLGNGQLLLRKEVEFNKKHLNAFGILKVAQTVSLFNSVLQYDRNVWSETQYGGWEEYGSGAYSFTHLPNESAITLNVGTALGDKAVRQQHLANRYQPGKALEVTTTYVPVIKDGVSNRIEYGNDRDGLTLEIKTIAGVTTTKFIIRSSTSGSPVEDAAYVKEQAAWNEDQLDGGADVNNESGITLDKTKGQILAIYAEWLSLGQVQFSFILAGEAIFAHTFNNVNALDKPYMKTANLPVRYILENIGSTASASSMKQICTSVGSSGGFEIERGIGSTAFNFARVTVDSAAYYPILHIRPRQQLNSINNEGILEAMNTEVNAKTNDIVWYWLLNGSFVGTVHSWVSPTGKMLEYDVTRTGTGITTTLGTIEHGGRAIAGGGGSAAGIFGGDPSVRILLGRNYDFTKHDILTLMARAETGSATVAATVDCREFW